MFFKKKKDDTEKVLKRIDGKLIKYVSSCDQNNVEEIIGRGGRLIVTDSQVAVNCDGKDVFVCPRDGLRFRAFKSQRRCCYRNG